MNSSPMRAGFDLAMASALDAVVRLMSVRFGFKLLSRGPALSGCSQPLPGILSLPAHGSNWPIAATSIKVRDPGLVTKPSH